MNRFGSRDLIAVQESAVATLSVLNEILSVFFSNNEVKSRNLLIATDDDIVQVITSDLASRRGNRNLTI